MKFALQAVLFFVFAVNSFPFVQGYLRKIKVEARDQQEWEQIVRKEILEKCKKDIKLDFGDYFDGPVFSVMEFQCGEMQYKYSSKNGQTANIWFEDPLKSENDNFRLHSGKDENLIHEIISIWKTTPDYKNYEKEHLEYLHLKRAKEIVHEDLKILRAKKILQGKIK